MRNTGWRSSGCSIPEDEHLLRKSWQNGVAERWVESCRRDLLDHIIAVNERHLKRLLSDYVATTTRTARLSDSGRDRRTVELVPEPQAASCLRSDSAGCIIVTSGLPDPDQLFTRLNNIYTLHACAHWFPSRENFALFKANLDRVQALFSS